MTERTVVCTKFGKELPGLEKPPFPGELGQRIYDQVSREAWLLWKDDMRMKVLNEYRLNMADPNDYNVLMEQMQLFLGIKAGENLEVENPERGQ